MEQPNLDNSGASGQTQQSASLSKYINLRFSNDVAAIILATFVGLVGMWSIITNIIIVRIPGRENKEKWVSVSVSSTTAALAAATGLSAAFLNWPQAQQNSALATFVVSQTATLGCGLVKDWKNLIPKLFDTAAVVVTILTVITTSHRYEWKRLHSPRIYCYGAAALIGISLATSLGCRFGNNNNKKQKQLIAVFTTISGIIMFGFAVRAATDMVLPYAATMGVEAFAVISLVISSWVFVYVEGVHKTPP